MYKSASTPFNTELPEPAQTANRFNIVSSVLFTPTETFTLFMPVWSLTSLMASFSVIGSVSPIRPAPIRHSSVRWIGIIGLTFEEGNALASQSDTPPWTASHDVCGENIAIRFSKHLATIRSFHVLHDKREENQPLYDEYAEISRDW